MASVTAPRFVQARDSDVRKDEVCERAWSRARAEYERGCVDCGKPWELHFRRGEWKGCGV